MQKLKEGKEKCKGQHFFDLLNWTHVVIAETDTKKAIVICRKCGEVRINKIYD